MSERASFARRIDALAEIFAFTAAALARQGVPDALLVDVDFVLEELFTNIVKYGAARRRWRSRSRPSPEAWR